LLFNASALTILRSRQPPTFLRYRTLAPAVSDCRDNGKGKKACTDPVVPTGAENLGRF
jgi:hypothetical protein